MADQRKADLIAQLQRARSQAAANSQALTEDLHVGDHVRENIANNRAAWLSGAVITGLVVSKIPPRTKQVVLHRGGDKTGQAVEKVGLVGVAFGVVKMVFSFFRPMLMRWFTARLTERGYLGPSGSRSARI